jgi:hypothetical protein
MGYHAIVLVVDSGAAHATLGRSVDGPSHMVDTPVVGLLIDRLGGGFAGRWCLLLPSLVPHLLAVVSHRLLVLSFAGRCLAATRPPVAVNLLPLLLRRMLLQVGS